MQCKYTIYHQLQVNALYLSDVDECSGYLNGGCDETCINMVGSFHCECTSGNSTLNPDGYSCSGMLSIITLTF